MGTQYFYVEMGKYDNLKVIQVVIVTSQGKGIQQQSQHQSSPYSNLVYKNCSEDMLDDLMKKGQDQVNRNIDAQNKEFQSMVFGGVGGFDSPSVFQEKPVTLEKITKCQYSDGKGEKAFKLEAEGTKDGMKVTRKIAAVAADSMYSVSQSQCQGQSSDYSEY